MQSVSLLNHCFLLKLKRPLGTIYKLISFACSYHEASLSTGACFILLISRNDSLFNACSKPGYCTSRSFKSGAEYAMKTATTSSLRPPYLILYSRCHHNTLWINLIGWFRSQGCPASSFQTDNRTICRVWKSAKSRVNISKVQVVATHLNGNKSHIWTD